VIFIKIIIHQHKLNKKSHPLKMAMGSEAEVFLSFFLCKKSGAHASENSNAMQSNLLYFIGALCFTSAFLETTGTNIIHCNIILF